MFRARQRPRRARPSRRLCSAPCTTPRWPSNRRTRHLVIHGSDVLVELDGNRTALTAALTNLVNNAFESSPDVIVTPKAKLLRRPRRIHGARQRSRHRAEYPVARLRAVLPRRARPARASGSPWSRPWPKRTAATWRCTPSAIAARASTSTLPRTAAVERTAAGDARLAGGCMSAGTILVVEDDRPLQDALVTTLEAAGFNVLAAGDGGEALKVLSATSVDLIVSDVEMQPVDGRELLRRLQQRDGVAAGVADDRLRHDRPGRRRDARRRRRLSRQAVRSRGARAARRALRAHRREAARPRAVFGARRRRSGEPQAARARGARRPERRHGAA